MFRARRARYVDRFVDHSIVIVVVVAAAVVTSLQLSFLSRAFIRRG